MKKERTNFASKAGMIAATVGSAVGLGNVWRFPNEVQSGGGAAFLIVYILCILVLGLPVMLAEFSLGRGGQSDVIGVYRKLTPGKKWWLGGAIALLAAYTISSYYMVVAGWTLEYLVQSVSGSLYEVAPGGTLKSTLEATLAENVVAVWSPLLASLLVVGANIFILLRGVQKGIEKMSNILMPVLFLLLLILCCVTLSLPGAADGLLFFLRPDFSEVTPAVVMNALGQAFFSLSLGMGILVTYSSYFPKRDNLVLTGVTVTACDFLVALLMGFIIFPAVMTFGLGGNEAGLESTALVFITLPEVFAQMGGTQVWSTVFFTLLFIAAVTSTISISEVSILYFQDRHKFSRRKATLVVLLPLVALSPLCSLSNGALADLKIAGLTLFDFLDTYSTNFLLPLAALVTCIYGGWVLKKQRFVESELTNGGRINRFSARYTVFMIRWIAPLCLGAIIVYQLLNML